MSRLKLASAPTFRDLGGISTGDGRQLRSGLLFRAGLLQAPDLQDEAFVRHLGLRRVFDLRSQVECQRQPSTWASYSAALTVHCDVNEDVRSAQSALLPLLQDGLTAHSAREMMRQNYRHLAAGFAGKLKAVFDALLDESGLPVLIHCTAGKDRTGFACAMILFALGVDEEQIYADYLRIADVLVDSPLADSMRQFLAGVLGHEPKPEAIAVLMSVQREFMELALTTVRTEYGQIDTYLEQVAGMTLQRREQLQQTLLR